MTKLSPEWVRTSDPVIRSLARYRWTTAPAGLACDPAKLSAMRNWHGPDKVKAVRQFVGFVGYYRQFVKDFAELAEPLVALTRKGAPVVLTANGI